MSRIAIPVILTWLAVRVARTVRRARHRIAPRTAAAREAVAVHLSRLQRAPRHRRALRRASTGAAVVLLTRAPRWLRARWSRVEP